MWGKPQDVSRHPEGEYHIWLWTLRSLTLMVNCAKATMERIVGKSMYVITQGRKNRREEPVRDNTGVH